MGAAHSSQWTLRCVVGHVEVRGELNRGLLSPPELGMGSEGGTSDGRSVLATPRWVMLGSESGYGLHAGADVPLQSPQVRVP